MRYWGGPAATAQRSAAGHSAPCYPRPSSTVLDRIFSPVDQVDEGPRARATGDCDPVASEGLPRLLESGGWTGSGSSADQPRATGADPQHGSSVNMVAANHLWGAPRIRAELLTLGIQVSERSVNRYMLKFTHAVAECHPAPRQQRVSPSLSLPQAKPAARLTLQFAPPSTSPRVFTRHPHPTECPLESPILRAPRHWQMLRRTSPGAKLGSSREPLQSKVGIVLGIRASPRAHGTRAHKVLAMKHKP